MANGARRSSPRSVRAADMMLLFWCSICFILFPRKPSEQDPRPGRSFPYFLITLSPFHLFPFRGSPSRPIGLSRDVFFCSCRATLSPIVDGDTSQRARCQYPRPLLACVAHLVGCFSPKNPTGRRAYSAIAIITYCTLILSASFIVQHRPVKQVLYLLCNNSQARPPDKCAQEITTALLQMRYTQGLRVNNVII